MSLLKIDTGFLNIENCSDAKVSRIVDLINEVYDEAEKDLWKIEGSRINKEVLQKMIQERTILVSSIENEIIGVVSVSEITSAIAGFSMLSTHKAHQGKGIGRTLINAVEEWAKGEKYAIMQLELLIPKTHKNASKEMLTNWYTQLGYQKTKTEPFENSYPDKAALLACECDFTIWQKNI